jgi:hypothetical protein
MARWTALLGWIQGLLQREDGKGRNEVLDPSTTVPQPFDELEQSLRQAVKSGERDESQRLLRELRQRYPIPAVDIVEKGVWGSEHDVLVFRTHAKTELKDAVANVECTGRSVSVNDQEQLQLVMSHWCAWSPTAVEHRNDPWMQYLRRAYYLEELQPILDTLIWPDELACYPPGYGQLPPWLFLLATSTMYYVYNLEDTAMFQVGRELSDVVDGVRKKRWIEGEMWEIVEENVMYEDPMQYFPPYDTLEDEG